GRGVHLVSCLFSYNTIVALIESVWPRFFSLAPRGEFQEQSSHLFVIHEGIQTGDHAVDSAEQFANEPQFHAVPWHRFVEYVCSGLTVETWFDRLGWHQ